jgi:hypothetical protein
MLERTGGVGIVFGQSPTVRVTKMAGDQHPWVALASVRPRR